MGQAAAGGLRCSGGSGSRGTTGWDPVVWVNLLLLFDLKVNLALHDEHVGARSSRFNPSNRKSVQL